MLTPAAAPLSLRQVAVPHSSSSLKKTQAARTSSSSAAPFPAATASGQLGQAGAAALPGRGSLQTDPLRGHIVALPGVSRRHTANHPAGASPLLAPPAPRVLQVQSAAELQHLLACHPNRLLVLHFAAAGCPLSEAFQPRLVQACRQHPAALFLCLTMQPGEAAAAAAATAGTPPGPGAAADRAELLMGLNIGQHNSTLLLRGQQLLRRLEIPANAGDNEDPAGVQAAAAAAAWQLGTALAAALPPAASATGRSSPTKQQRRSAGHSAVAAAAGAS